jgi:hypothetical protein
MSRKLSAIIASVLALPMLAFATPAFAAITYGQIESGDIYRAENITAKGSFADSISATCNNIVAFRAQVYNSGAINLTSVKASATLSASSATSHTSTVSLSAANNIDKDVAKATTTIKTSKTTTLSYVKGSTELLDANGSKLKTLADGITTSTGVSIGTVETTTSNMRAVQFEAKVTCPASTTPTPAPTPKPTPKPTPTAVYSCDLLHVMFDNDSRKVTIDQFQTTQTNATFKNADINWGDTVNGAADILTTPSVIGQMHTYAAAGTYTITATGNFTVGSATKTAAVGACTQTVTFTAATTTPPTTTPTTPATTTVSTAAAQLPDTGAGNVIGIFAVVVAAGSIAYRLFLNRKLARR